MRFPGEAGDYIWIAIGLAMIGAGLVPMLFGGAEHGGDVSAAGPSGGATGGEGRTLPPTTTRSPLPTLPDLTHLPPPPPGDTLA